MRLLLFFIVLPILTGCGAAEYQQAQPKIAQQRAAETRAIGNALVGMTKAIMGQQASIPPAVHPAKQADKQAAEPCKDCGGPEGASLTFIPDGNGGWVEQSLAGTDQEYQPAEVDGMCPSCDQYQVPLPGQIPPSAPPPATGGAELLLRYIMAQQQTAAKQAVAAEKTKQVRAITALAATVFTRPQHQQAAPFDPTNLGKAIVEQTPLGLAIWGLQSLGKSKGNSSTAATISNGSSLGQGGDSGAGYSAPITTTKTTTK